MFSAAFLAFLPGCAEPEQPVAERPRPQVLAPATPSRQAPGNAPDIVLFTVEGLRADQVAAAPWMSTLAAGGLSFGRAYATAPWPLPSVASALSGLYPKQHGVDRGLMGRDGPIDQPVLPARLLTLAERLDGYQAAAVVNSPQLSAAQGFDQGFLQYVALPDADPAGLADAVAGLSWDGRPRFLWVHVAGLGSSYPPTEAAAAEDGAALLAGRLDAVLGQIDASLRQIAAGQPDALILLAGTNGLERGEHGRNGPRAALFESSVRVPLILSGPQVPAQRSEVPVSLADITPTLVSLATGQASPPAVSGADLSALLRGAALPERALPLELRVDATHTMRGLVWRDQKLIRLYDQDTVVWSGLYALALDPGESDPLHSGPESDALAATLDEWLAQTSTVESTPTP